MISLVKSRNSARSAKCLLMKYSLQSLRNSVYTNPHENRQLLKNVFKPEKFDNAAFAFSVERQHFESESLR